MTPELKEELNDPTIHRALSYLQRLGYPVAEIIETERAWCGQRRRSSVSIQFDGIIATGDTLLDALVDAVNQFKK